MQLTLITLGVLFAVGLVADEIGRRTRLPRVTLLVLLGVLIGPAGFDLLPDMAREWYDMVAAIALTMVAFLLAGSRLYTDHWMDYAGLVAAFVVLRIASRFIGGWVGGSLAASNKGMKLWMGVALLPQAGVAVGMALVAGYHFPAYQEMILNVAIITTVIFEVLGPIAAKVALLKNARVKAG